MDVKADALVLEASDELRGETGQVNPEALNPVVEIRINSFDHGAAATVIDVNGRHPAGIHVIQEAAVGHAGDRRISGGGGWSA